MNIIYSVIIPVYNEELIINQAYTMISDVMASTDEYYELIFVNDGSRDNSLNILVNLAKIDNHIRIINFTRNFGHQCAITAGMDYAQGDAIVIIDADMQDPPPVILLMIEKWKQGYDVVYGKRNKRNGEKLIKKITSKIYYRILKSITTTDIPLDTGDFRLIDRKVCDSMKLLNEKNRYIRGLVSWVGYKQIAVEYDRDKRFAGSTKYSIKKMFMLAFDGITSFSYKPLRIASFVGFLLSLFSFIYLIFVIYEKLFTENTVQGWSSIIIVLLFTQGIVLILLGLIGEYIGRMYEEVKNRPIYIINDTIGYEKK